MSMGCLWLLGLGFLALGVTQAHGASVIIGGLILYFAWDLTPRDNEYSRVRNRIIAQDGNGRFLVEAKTSRQITGPRPHVEGNLPAAIYSTGKGMFIVDTSASRGAEPEDIHWQPVAGNFSIEPRGDTKTRGFLADQMEGWEHSYIKEHNDD
jgi:hypothetical protein